MRGTVEEFLQVASQNKRVRFSEILSHHRELPGVDKLKKKSRVTGQATPYQSVTHILRRTVLLGVNYQDMVNAQRNKEADAALAEMLADLPFFINLTAEVEEFTAGKLWGGKGKRDDQFPNMAARHVDTGAGYLIFWPKCDKEGKPVNNENRYVDQDGNDLDFKTQVEEFWEKKSDKPSKTQGTIKKIRWSTLKFENVVRISSDKLVWDIDR